MRRILYIGNDEVVQQSLDAAPGVELIQVQNVVGLHNYLPNLEQVHLIISDWRLKGLDGLGIYHRFKNNFNDLGIPFCLCMEHTERSLKRSLLKEGISEIFTYNIDAGELASTVDFHRDMLAARLRTDVIKPSREYKIPLSKRIFDIVVAGLALIILSPIILLAALAIRIESKGPILYVSKRVGTGYKVFDFYKLRSMYIDADKRMAEMKHLNQYAAESQESTDNPVRRLNGSRRKHSPTLIYKDGRPMSETEYLELKRKQQSGTFVKFKEDPRITKVGKFIRNTSIDELPQLINVLKGDMSIVGNRPLPLYEAEQLTSDDWGERFLAPAGITGLWQVMKRGKGEMSEEERKALDNQYARKVSLFNDIKLIVRTVPALFQKENV